MSVSKTTFVAVAILLLTFVAGFAVGIFTDHMMILWHRSRRLPPFATHIMAGRLDHHLDLTDDQRAKVEKILERHHERINSYWAGVRPKVRAEVEQANAEIERVLTPEQREKFGKMRMRMRPPGPPPHHPPH